MCFDFSEVVERDINIGSRKKTTLSSRQACFVISHSSGDFNDKNIHNHRLYTLRLHCWGIYIYIYIYIYILEVGKKLHFHLDKPVS